MKIVSFGEIMLRLSPAGFGRFLDAPSYEATFGGAEANTALQLALLGADSEYITRMPENDIAQAAINSLRRYGVKCDRIVRCGDKLGIYFIEKGASQRPSKVIYDRAGSAISKASPDEFNWEELLSGADVFHFTGITLALGNNLIDICHDACRTAKRMGVKVSFDPNHRTKLWSYEKATSVIEQFTKYIDILITNEDHSAKLFGISPSISEINGDDVTEKGYMQIARAFDEKYGIKTVAITERRTVSSEVNTFCAKLYESGRLCSSKKYTINIVDRLGAGDAFAAALIYAIEDGMEADKSIEFAAAACCLKHTIQGDQSLLTKEEISALAFSNQNARVQR